MSEHDQVYADEYKFLVVKTVSEWKRTFHSNLQIQNEYIIFYHIWFIFCILEQVFQMAHKQIVPLCWLTPTLVFDIKLVVYNQNTTYFHSVTLHFLEAIILYPRPVHYVVEG